MTDNSNPEKVTLRLVTYTGAALIVEHDGVRLATYYVDVHMDDPSSVVKAFELAYASLGYKPDLYHMYIDDSLMVLNLYRDEIPADPPPSCSYLETLPYHTRDYCGFDTCRASNTDFRDG